jgi:hypothetical protein
MRVDGMEAASREDRDGTFEQTGRLQGRFDEQRGKAGDALWSTNAVQVSTDGAAKTVCSSCLYCSSFSFWSPPSEMACSCAARSAMLAGGGAVRVRRGVLRRLVPLALRLLLCCRRGRSALLRALAAPTAPDWSVKRV